MLLWRKKEWYRENYPHVKCLANNFAKFFPSENNHVYSSLVKMLGFQFLADENKGSIPWWLDLSHPYTKHYHNIHFVLSILTELGSRLGLRTTSVWNIIQVQLSSKKLRPRQGFQLCVHCDLDLWDMSLGQGHDTPLGWGKQSCTILSRSNFAGRSYGLDKDFSYMCTVTLILEIWRLVKVKIYGHIPLGYGQQLKQSEILSIYVKSLRSYGPDKVDGQTEGQTGRFLFTCIPPPPNCVCGGYKKTE